jgi:hypothetical protein
MGCVDVQKPVKVVVMRVMSKPDSHVFLTLQTPSLPALVKTDAL